eukprot:jgi/Orpsp1_1/1181322/evm.model.c7180000076773.1
MEILTSYDNINSNDISDNISEGKKFFFKNHENSLTFFNDSTKLIINNPSLTLRILQDIKRRDEIRELYISHINNDKSKKNYNQTESSNNNETELTENDANDFFDKNDDTGNENVEEVKITKVINKYKISKRMQSEIPMPLHDLNKNKKIKPIFPEGKKCALTLPLFLEINQQETFYITEDKSEEIESNIDKTFNFEPYLVYNEYWDEIPIPRSINDCAPPLVFDSRFESGNLHKVIR